MIRKILIVSLPLTLSGCSLFFTGGYDDWDEEGEEESGSEDGEASDGDSDGGESSGSSGSGSSGSSSGSRTATR